MKRPSKASIAAALCVVGLTIAACRPAAETVEHPETIAAESKTLRAFADEKELRGVLDKFREAGKKHRARSQAILESGDAAADAMPMSAAAPEAAAEAASDAAAAPAEASKDESRSDEESITNVQTAGVDEGGIVKRQGDFLIVLRRGRLFTLRIGGDDLRPVSSVDAYGPGIDPNGAWYDEMLVSDKTVVVIGYSYQRGGTEVGLFDLDGNGGLNYRATYHLRSNDYYSSRNYASRMIGDKLVFYSPMFMNFYSDAAYDDMLPAVRRWRTDAKPGDFKRILPADRIYRGREELDIDQGVAFHTVTICDLSGAEMACEATAVMGYPGQVFYVSEDSAFVWTVPWNGSGDAPKQAQVFRIPLDGSAPTALMAKGAPIDQMSFLQKDGYLNVMLSSGGMGQWMWQGEATPGDFALMRVPLSMFGDGRDTVGSDRYRPLREPGLGEYGLQNRYIGDWLILGASRNWMEKSPAKQAFAISYADGDFVEVPVGHPVERVDALGSDGIAIGEADGALHFTSLALGANAEVAGRFSLRDARQGDQRTHGFFYRATGSRQGFVGLPILGGATDGGQKASVLFLRNQDLRLQDAGTLGAMRKNLGDDGCKASCVDWYGDARPIFIGERVFALLGYELVEGRFEAGRVQERRRVDFAPAVAIAD